MTRSNKTVHVLANSHQASVEDDVEVSLLADVFLLVMDRLNLRCRPPHASHRQWLVERRCRSTHEFLFFFMFLLKFDVFFVEIHRNETDLIGFFCVCDVVSSCMT